MEMIFETNLLYDFHISKLKDLKVIYHLYSQCLTPILSKRFFFTKPEGVYLKPRMICCGLVELVLFKLVSTPWRRLCDIVPGTESAQTGCKGMVM